MKNHALYFMPDISGFTNFVTSTETEHSKHIISELLEILLDNNTIGLKLVEIEGDALFMYTTEFPEFDQLVAQSKQMLNAFAQHLHLYNTSRICDCGACTTAQDLQVKFLIHYGNISFIRVKDIVKPYGADVIKIHRLLKNSIPSDQYLLISQPVIDFYNIKGSEINDFLINEDVYDYGTSKYVYTVLDKYIKPLTIPIQLSKKPSRLPEIKYQIDTLKNIDEAYKFISSFKHRHEWYKLVDRLEFDNLRINRAGTLHECIAGSNVFKVETLKWKLEVGEKGYGERTADIPNIDEYQYYITLKENNNSTNITIEVFMELSKSLNNTNKLIKEITEAWEKSIMTLKEILNTQL